MNFIVVQLSTSEMGDHIHRVVFLFMACSFATNFCYVEMVVFV
jgi:hypothetical protein